MTATRISNRDYQTIRARYWNAKREQERADFERERADHELALRKGTWFRVAHTNPADRFGSY